GGVHSRLRSLRRLLTSTRPPTSTPPTRGINAPPTTQFLMPCQTPLFTRPQPPVRPTPLGPAAPGAPPSPAAEVVDPLLDDDDQCFAHDSARHLRRAGGAVAERDRELDDLSADANQPVGHLDREAVALGCDGVELHPLERIGSVGAVPGGGVVDRQPEH